MNTLSKARKTHYLILYLIGIIHSSLIEPAFHFDQNLFKNIK